MYSTKPPNPNEPDSLTVAGTLDSMPTSPRLAKIRWLRLVWILLGPGLIAMIGDNDAGGVISYAATGVTFGFSIFLPLVLLLAPVTYAIQEMSMRLGLVSQKPFPVLVYAYFGKFWGSFSLSTLLIENILTLVTEFIGMSIGLSVLGIPYALADVISLVASVGFALFGRYWSKERLALIVGALNLVFVGIAVVTLHHELWIGTPIIWQWHAGNNAHLMLYFILATIGNAVAPWMIFFQGSAVIDKGMTHRDLHYGRLDTALGSVVQSVIAFAILLCGAALFHYGLSHPGVSAAPISMFHGFYQAYGVYVRDLFALGLINAGFLAAITISLSTSWTYASVFQWAKSLNDRPWQAPKFYIVYVGGLVVAAAIVLIPHLPLTSLAVATQVIAAILMIPILIFLILLTSDTALMGIYRNHSFAKWRAWAITLLIVVFSLSLFWGGGS